MRKISRYFKGVAEEAHRVRWPGAKELWKSVAIVLVITIVCCIVLVISDLVAGEMRNAFQQQVSSSTASGSNAANSVDKALRYVFHI